MLANCQKLSSDSGSDHDSGTIVVTEKQTKVKKPRLYKVLLMNDDYTPMEFVVSILEKYFDQDHTGATQIMLKVHNNGSAVCGVYPFEIAETKVAAVINDARHQGYPLQCTTERE